MSEITKEQAERILARVAAQYPGSYLTEPEKLAYGLGWTRRALVVKVGEHSFRWVPLQDAHAEDPVLLSVLDALRAEGILPPPAGMVTVPVQMAARLQSYANFAAPHWTSAGMSSAEEDTATLGKLIADQLGWEAPTAGEEPKGTEEGEG
jgi:hypothetical protein